MLKKFIVALTLLASAPAWSQWQVPNNSIPIGRGTGVTGFNSAAPGTAGQVLASNGASSAPSFQPLSSIISAVCSSFPTTCKTLFGYVNVAWYGTVGNGTADDTTAIQAAATAACGTVGVGGSGAGLYLPAGFYKTTTVITIPCGLKLYGDGWSADSGAGIQNNFITSTAGLSGSIIIPSATNSGLRFVTNQAATVSDIGVFYPSRPSALSGIAGITIQAAASATSPAPLAWNVGSSVDHVWIYGADRNLVLDNIGSFTVSNNLFQAHTTSGIRVQGANLPYAGDWAIGPGNTFWSGSVTTCQHILITSGGGGRVQGNKLNTCGSNNVIPPLTTTGIQWSPDLNVANNSLEPIVVVGNTIEGLSRCLWFYGGNVGQNSTATQIVIAANQMWCLENIHTDPTSTNAQWISGVTIAGNYMTSQTLAGITTTTSNLNLDGINNVNVTGNQFGLYQGAGGDTSTAITVGVHAAGVYQFANKTLVNVTMPSTIPLAADGTGTGVEAALRVNVGSAGAPVLFNGAGGTPSSLTLTNATGLPIGGITGLSANCGTWLATASSANLRSCMTDETGTGVLYFQGGDAGTPSALVGTNITGLNATQLTTGTVPAARMPAFTGDCTTSAGAVAVTCTQSAGDFNVTGILRTGGDVRVSTQFDKTSDTTLANVPGLSVTLTSGLTYGFEVKLYTSANSASGVKASIAGTATATAFTATQTIFSSSGFAGYGRVSSIGAGAPTGSTASTDAMITLTGTITVNAGGTLTAQFAQNVSGGVASSVLVGSTMRVWKIQ